jgi:hypothetical protein
VDEASAAPYSVVIEWENAAFTELERPRRMLRALRAQIAGLEAAHGVPELLVTYDPRLVPCHVVEGELDAAACDVPCGAETRLLPVPGLRYLHQKTAGARAARGELVVLLDSDVVPRPGWLRLLLEAFADPDVHVVGGATFIWPQDSIYEKTFALVWFFPRRVRGDDLRRGSYWPNNVAFRRATFLAHPYADVAVFRGLDRYQREELEAAGIAVYMHRGARVEHPPPSLFRRALLHGYDRQFHRVYLRGRPDVRADLVAAARVYGQQLRRAGRRLARNHAKVGLRRRDLPPAFGLAGVWFTTQLVGELASVVAPSTVLRAITPRPLRDAASAATSADVAVERA